MDGLNELIDVVENKIDELGEGTSIQNSTNIQAGDDVLNKVLNDPNVELGEPDDKGNQCVTCNGKEIGWVNSSTGESDIDDSYCGKEDVSATQRITSASLIETTSDLEDAISNELDSDICTEIVNLAVGEDGTFEDDAFLETDEFFNIYLSNADAKEIALKFFNGEDLDDGGPANPERDYLKFDEDDNVVSTDYPGDYYFDNLFDAIVGYIMDHLEDREFPDYIQDLINEYLENRSEEE